LEAAAAREEDTDLKTTDGYVITESGPVDNFAVEPPIYWKGGNRWKSKNIAGLGKA
jgi:hypothetical protein